MAILFTCRNCGGHCSVPNQLAGKLARCGRCGKAQFVPDADELSAPIQSQQPAIKEVEKPRPSRPRPAVPAPIPLLRQHSSVPACSPADWMLWVLLAMVAVLACGLLFAGSDGLRGMVACVVGTFLTLLGQAWARGLAGDRGDRPALAHSPSYLLAHRDEFIRPVCCSLIGLAMLLPGVCILKSDVQASPALATTDWASPTPPAPAGTAEDRPQPAPQVQFQQDPAPIPQAAIAPERPAPTPRQADQTSPPAPMDAPPATPPIRPQTVTVRIEPPKQVQIVEKQELEAQALPFTPAPDDEDAASLGHLGRQLAIFADRNNGRFPAKLAESLRVDQALILKAWPYSTSDRSKPYQYIAGQSTDCPAGNILAYATTPSAKGQFYALTVGGEVVQFGSVQDIRHHLTRQSCAPARAQAPPQAGHSIAEYWANEGRRLALAKARLTELHEALRLRALGHYGQFPPNLSTLIRETWLEEDRRALLTSVADTRKALAYIPNLTSATDPSHILVYDEAHYIDGTIVSVQVDGKIRLFKNLDDLRDVLAYQASQRSAAQAH